MQHAVDSLVLAKVNAPYSKPLDAAAVIACIINPPLSKSAAGPMSSFFYDVERELQEQFVQAHGLTIGTLDNSANWFDNWSGSVRAA